MVDRILVPLDGSATGESILPLVESVARRASAEILLLRVEDLTLLQPDSGFQDQALTYARGYLDRTAKTLANEAGLRTRGLVKIGRPDRVIVDVARDEQVSLIGMATHGFTGSLSACFGSVTESVLRMTPVPLLAFRPFVRPPGTARMTAPSERFRSIVLATDGSDFSLKGADALVDLAKVFGSRIDLVHVLPAGTRAPSISIIEGLDALARRFERDAIPTRLLLEHGLPEEVLPKVARREGADLIALTTHGRSGILARVVGSVTEGVLQRADLPLFVVRSTEGVARGTAGRSMSGRT
jgi:nucleotide-binding universal stress UspA family protein